MLQSSVQAPIVVQLFIHLLLNSHTGGDRSVLKLGGGGMVGVSINSKCKRTSEKQQQTAAMTFRNRVIHMKMLAEVKTTRFVRTEETLPHRRSSFPHVYLSDSQQNNLKTLITDLSQIFRIALQWNKEQQITFWRCSGSRSGSRNLWRMDMGVTSCLGEGLRPFLDWLALSFAFRCAVFFCSGTWRENLQHPLFISKNQLQQLRNSRGWEKKHNVTFTSAEFLHWSGNHTSRHYQQASMLLWKADEETDLRDRRGLQLFLQS